MIVFVSCCLIDTSVHSGVSCTQLLLSAAPVELIECICFSGRGRSSSACVTCNVSHPALKRVPITFWPVSLSLCIGSEPKCQMVGHRNDMRRQIEPSLSSRVFYHPRRFFSFCFSFFVCVLLSAGTSRCTTVYVMLVIL